jgi:hypothetical protein
VFAWLIAAAVEAAVDHQQQHQEEQQQDACDEPCDGNSADEQQQQQQTPDLLWHSSPADRQQLQQQLFSLLICCSKISARSVRGMYDPLRQVAAILQTGNTLAGCLVSSSSSSSVPDMWALLLSRGLFNCGQRLQELATPSGSSSTAGTSAAAGVAAAGISDDSDLDVPGEHAQLGQSLQLQLPCLQAAVGSLMQRLPLLQLPGWNSSSTAGVAESLAAAEAAGASSSSSSSTFLLQQLMPQAEDVQQQILRCQAALSSSAADFSVHAGLLGQALVSFGGALCAVLPSKHCCNHTGCTNLTRLSEAELVAGKGCVCGR